MIKEIPTLQDLLAAVVAGLGYEFIGFELQGQGSGKVLRVYIDKPDGIVLDDCSRVSRQLSAMLDVEDPIPGHYSLEISSPGLNRPLFTLQHYQQQIGQKVKVRLFTPVQKQRKWVGILTRVEGNNIHLLIDQTEMVLPFSDIEKANVIADIR